MISSPAFSDAQTESVQLLLKTVLSRPVSLSQSTPWLYCQLSCRSNKHTTKLWWLSPSAALSALMAAAETCSKIVLLFKAAARCRFSTDHSGACRVCAWTTTHLAKLSKTLSSVKTKTTRDVKMALVDQPVLSSLGVLYKNHLNAKMESVQSKNQNAAMMASVVPASDAETQSA